MEEKTTWVRMTRRDLHRIPEIGFDLFETSAYIHDRLSEMGYQPIAIAKTGWIVVIEGQVDESIAFRADMDGLPVSEQTQAVYGSQNKGKDRKSVV